MDRHQAALQILAEGTVIPATPLALNSERKLDERRQRALLRYYLESGCGGIATAVHTTQFEIRDKEVGLFEPVLRIVIEEIDRYEKERGKTIVRICGVCGESGQAVQEAKLARSLGFDAVLLSPGGLNHLSEAQMLQRTRDVAEIMPVIGFYMQNSVGGRRFSYEYWKQLCEIDQLVAIKSAPFNRYQTLDLVRAAATSKRADEIALYTGNDDNIIVDLLTKYRFTENGKTCEKRFVGGLLGQWAVWTNTTVKLYEKIRKVREEESIPQEYLTMAAQLTDVNGALFDVANNFKGCIAGVHEVLRRQGLMEGIWCLNPKETLSEGQIAEIDRVYEMYPALNDDAFVRENLSRWLEA